MRKTIFLILDFIAKIALVIILRHYNFKLKFQMNHISSIIIKGILNTLGIFMTWLMKEYFYSFDDIYFFHTISYIFQYLKIVTLKRIQCLVQNFMSYKMIYHLTHKFVFLNFCFSPFYEQFRHLREKYPLKWQTKYTVLFRISCPTRWYIICLINLNFWIFNVAILRTFSLITREIFVGMTNKAHNFNLLIELVLMMCMYIIREI